VPGVKLDGGLLVGKSATIWLLEALIVANGIESSVTLAALPKFCPVIVSVLALKFTVALCTTGNPPAHAGEARSASAMISPPLIHANTPCLMRRPAALRRQCTKPNPALNR
jgi:hypothetical protein